MERTLKAPMAAICTAVLTATASLDAQAFPINIKNGPQAAWLGSGQCGDGRTNAKRKPEEDIQLNWILGFLSGRAASGGRDFLANVSNDEIWRMAAVTCAAQPHSLLGTIAFGIERDLIARHKATRRGLFGN